MYFNKLFTEIKIKYLFIEHLKNMNNKQHIVIQQLATGLKTTRSVKMKYILNSLRIKNAAALLSTGTITFCYSAHTALIGT